MNVRTRAERPGGSCAGSSLQQHLVALVQEAVAVGATTLTSPPSQAPRAGVTGRGIRWSIDPSAGAPRLCEPGHQPQGDHITRGTAASRGADEAPVFVVKALVLGGPSAKRTRSRCFLVPPGRMVRLVVRSCAATRCHADPRWRRFVASERAIAADDLDSADRAVPVSLRRRVLDGCCAVTGSR